jgi:hypothetical protein
MILQKMKFSVEFEKELLSEENEVQPEVCSVRVRHEKELRIHARAQQTKRISAGRPPRGH